MFRTAASSLSPRSLNRISTIRMFSKHDSSLMDSVEKMRSKLGVGSSSSWESLWSDGITPWDLGKPTPLLAHELEQKRSQLLTTSNNNQLRTLVPGCGAGYDLVTLAQNHNAVEATDSIVIGIDIAPTSLVKAQKTLEENSVQDIKTRVELVQGDFLESPLEWESVYSNQRPAASAEKPAKFHLIFDYTFFVALRPDLRSHWGQQMAQLLEHDGTLMTIMFPILPDADPLKGPPYPVSIKDYEQVLQHHGIVIDGEPFESPHSVASRAGKEMVCYWKHGDNGKSSL